MRSGQAFRESLGWQVADFEEKLQSQKWNLGA